MINTNTGTMSLQEDEQGQHDSHHLGWPGSRYRHQTLPNVRKKKLDMCIMDSEEKKVGRRGTIDAGSMKQIQG
jgi:hypothetical protein